MNLPQIPADKAQHFIYGLAIALIGAFIVSRVAPHDILPISPAAFGAVLAGLFGAGKEVADRAANKALEQQGEPPAHGVEVADAAATLAGGLACLAASYMG